MSEEGSLRLRVVGAELGVMWEFFRSRFGVGGFVLAFTFWVVWEMAKDAIFGWLNTGVGKLWDEGEPVIQEISPLLVTYGPPTSLILIAYGLAWITYKYNSQQKLNIEPDITTVDAWEYLLLESKWAIGRDPTNTSEFFNAALEQITDAANLGKLKIWGRAHQPNFDPGAMEEIKFKNWGPVVIWASLNALKNHDTEETFVETMVNQKQIKVLWPKANILEIRRDKNLVKRREFFHG